MKSAIIGLGVIGKVHLETLLMQSRDIVALCDVDTDAANTAAYKVAGNAGYIGKMLFFKRLYELI